LTTETGHSFYTKKERGGGGKERRGKGKGEKKK